MYVCMRAGGLQGSEAADPTKAIVTDNCEHLDKVMGNELRPSVGAVRHLKAGPAAPVIAFINIYFQSHRRNNCPGL